MAHRVITTPLSEDVSNSLEDIRKKIMGCTDFAQMCHTLETSLSDLSAYDILVLNESLLERKAFYQTMAVVTMAPKVELGKLHYRIMVDKALSSLEEMHGLDLHRDIDTYISIVGACAAVQGQPQLVIKLVDQAKRYCVAPTKSFYHAAIKACRRRPDLALGLLEDMKGKGLEPDSITYSCLIKCYSQEEQTEAALQFLADVNENSTGPSRGMYVNAISTCRFGRQADLALELLEQLKRDGLSLETDVCVPTIAACVAGRRMPKVFEILDNASQAGLALDATWYVAALKAGKGQVDTALQLLEDMQERGVEPDATTYSTFIRCCIAGGQPQLGLDLLEEITSDRLNLNSSSRHEGIELSWQNYAGFIHSCVKTGETDLAMKLFEEMKESGLLANNPQAYEGVIQGCLWLDTCSEAVSPVSLAFFNDMLNQTGGTVRAYDVIIQACKHGSKALELLEQMESHGLTPTGTTYYRAIQACEKSGDTSFAVQLLNDARSQGITLPTCFYKPVLQLCASGGHADTAQELLEDMEGQGITPGKYAYSFALDACVPHGHADTALQLLQDMEAVPSRSHYITVIGILEDAGEPELARDLLKQAMRTGQLERPWWQQPGRSRPFRSRIQKGPKNEWVLDLRGHTERSSAVVARWWLEEKVAPWAAATSLTAKSAAKSAKVNILVGKGAESAVVRRSVLGVLTELGVPVGGIGEESDKIPVFAKSWIAKRE
jgi:pentatricopeptide repeat protein